MKKDTIMTNGLMIRIFCILFILLVAGLCIWFVICNIFFIRIGSVDWNLSITLSAVGALLISGVIYSIY